MTSAVDVEPGPEPEPEPEPAPEPELSASTPEASPPQPKTRRGLRRVAVATITAASVVIVAMAAYAGAALVHPLPATAAVIPADATASIETAAVAPAWPTHGGAAVGLVGRQGLLGSSGSDASVPIASITKTITALVLLDKYKLKSGQPGPTITFGQRDVDLLNQVWTQDGSWAGVQAGEKLTLTQAITAMMLRSANNYARSLAEWSYGSQPAFDKAANAWLKQHGFAHTHLTDPSGFDSGTVSNMTDLVGIGELAIANPVLAHIVNTPSATLPAPLGEIHNTDPLIGTHGIEGIKTGFTDQAGHCLLFAAKVDLNGTAHTLVGVMVGQPTYDALWAGVPKLLTSFERAFHQVDLTDAGKTVYATYRTPWGASTRLVAVTRPSVEIFSASTVDVSVAADKLATAAAKDTVGTVTFTYGGKRVVADLATDAAMAAPTPRWRLTHPVELFRLDELPFWRNLFDKRSLLGP